MLVVQLHLKILHCLGEYYLCDNVKNFEKHNNLIEILDNIKLRLI